MTTTRRVKPTGRMAEHAKNKATPGVILPVVKERLLKDFGPDTDRDPTVIHPSEMCKPDWCLRSTYERIVAGKWPDGEKFDFVRENIFDEGNDIHTKWQNRLRKSFPLWGNWRCLICKEVARNMLEPERQFGPVCESAFGHIWEYDEVSMIDRATTLIGGHSDGAFDDYLVEIKSIGLGTLRIEAPSLLGRYQDGRNTDLTGLWRGVERPLQGHLRQGDVYLSLAHILGLPFTKIIYLYEFKANQMTKEFTVTYDEERAAPLIAKALRVKYAVDGDKPPPDCHTPGGCKDCKAYAPAKKRRTVVTSVEETVEPNERAVSDRVQQPDAAGRKRRVVT